MKEVHELSLDLYEAKIGTYVQDIIPVEETNEIVRTERSGIPFPKQFAKWKSQNPNAKLKKPKYLWPSQSIVITASNTVLEPLCNILHAPAS